MIYGQTAHRTDYVAPSNLMLKALVGYRMCTPLMALAMINRWISLVPSKMV